MKEADKPAQDKDDHNSDAKSEKSAKSSSSSSSFNDSEQSENQKELLAKLARMKVLLAQKKMGGEKYKKQILKEADHERRRQEK